MVLVSEGPCDLTEARYLKIYYSYLETRQRIGRLGDWVVTFLLGSDDFCVSGNREALSLKISVWHISGERTISA